MAAISAEAVHPVSQSRPVIQRPRSLLRRGLTAGLIFIGLVGVPLTLRALLPGTGGDLVAIAPVLAAGALIAPKVSYRWFDAFLLLVPVYGIYLMGLYAWRLAYLPHRDWPLRPGERPDGSP